METSVNGIIRPGPLEKELQARLASLGGRLGEADARRLAEGLGWFSVGLGALELGAPRAFAALTGAGRTLPGRLVVRAFGARELLAGAGIIGQRDPGPWLWARVAGDVMDLGMLGAAFVTRRRARRRSKARLRLLASATSVVAVTAVDAIVATRLGILAGMIEADGTMHVRAAVTIDQPPNEVYERWRRVEDLPRALHHVRAVQPGGEGRTHWVARGPLGRDVEWDAEITEDLPSRSIAWRSASGSGIENRGIVRFDEAPGGRGTELAVELWYAPPGGIVGTAVATVSGEGPREQLKDDLYRFKQFVETGDIARSEASPEGAAVRQLFHQRAAQPAA